MTARLSPSAASRRLAVRQLTPRRPTLRRLALPGVALALGVSACGGSSTSDLGTVTAPTGHSTTSASHTPAGCQTNQAPVSPPAALASPPSVPAGTGSPPSTTQVTTLIKGSGPVVQRGDCVLLNYVGVNFADGKIFDSSFRHPGTGLQATAGGSGLIQGFSDALVGVPVGSRIKLVIPPSEGYGDNPPGPLIVANETLIFVVDVLRIVPS